jgi:hypothetical protein
MTKNTLSIAPGVITEHIGDDVVVMLPGSTDVLRLSGDAAGAVRVVQAGGVPSLPSETVSDLVKRGVLVSQAEVSRRDLIKAGAIGAGAGIAVLAMPGVAAASSVQRTQLIGVYYPGFYIASYTDSLLEESAVQSYLEANGLPADLPSVPDPLITDDEGILLDVPELGIFGAEVDSFINDPGYFQIEWDVNAGVNAPDFMVGYFTWNQQEFEVHFVNDSN